MIARVRGIIESIEGQTVVLRSGPGLANDPTGAAAALGAPGLAGFDVWLEVMTPQYVARRLATSIGQPVTFWTMAYLEGQNQGSSFIPRLIGFSTAREREFFELFTTVKGIGNRRALRALAEDPGAIAGAVMRGDAKALTQLPEVGKRLAETIIAELKGKVDAFADLEVEIKGTGRRAGGGVTPTSTRSTAEEDAVAALMNLGQKRDEAERNIAKVVGAADATTKPWTVDELVRAVFAAR
jgi:Holliday junction DNA helicase RuvA